jgi:hypothetical protein
MQRGAAIAIACAVPLAIAGCTPSPDAICAHYQTLDDAAPQLRVGNAPPHPSSKVASCTRQANRLRSVDSDRYATLAKCVMRAKSSADAWDCWVGTHVSPKDTNAFATYSACNTACTTKHTACYDRCLHGSRMTPIDSCSTACQDKLDVCATRCEFP